MSDVNVTIKAVDDAMDIMDAFSREIHDLRAYAIFEINETVTSVEREKWIAEECERDYEYNHCSNEELDSGEAYIAIIQRAADLRHLAYVCELRGEELKEEWTGLCSSVVNLATNAKRIMGEYIRKLNKIGCGIGMVSLGSVDNEPEYYVVIVDSSKYPQTAEHIRIAQHMGFPEFVTLGRDGAADRRKASLAHVRSNSIYDRDEWPMAVFREGGTGADVTYIEGRDNRGAGSSIGWQMRSMPDGSRVRVRVV